MREETEKIEEDDILEIREIVPAHTKPSKEKGKSKKRKSGENSPKKSPSSKKKLKHAEEGEEKEASFSSPGSLKKSNVVNVENIFCRSCGEGNNAKKLILCDGCDNGYHIFCLTPKKYKVPKTAWFCENCKLKQPSYQKKKSKR